MSRRRVYRWLIRRRADERGYVLVFMSIFLVALLIMAAFAVDVGYWYSKANQTQRAADAAAMAGVIYMPTDLAQATTAARAIAKKNGYDDASSDIDVNVSAGSTPRRLNVQIVDRRVPSIFGTFVNRSIQIQRGSIGEYVQQIPLGSAYNAIGTGTQLAMSPGGTTTQDFWLAASGYCSAKEDGDMVLSAFDGTRTRSDPTIAGCALGNPASATQNLDYSDKGYNYVVNVPCPPKDPATPCSSTDLAGQNVAIQVFDPVFDPNSKPNNGVPCSDKDRDGNGIPDGEETDILGNAVGCTYVFPALAGERRTDLTTDPRPDLRVLSGDGSPDWNRVAVNTTFVVYNVDDTPNYYLDDTELARVTYGTCDSSLAYGTTPQTCAGARQWVTIANITPAMRAGRYRVQVFTEQGQQYSFGSNAFSMRAMVGGSFSLCDSRTVTTCPGVSGDTSMSAYVNSTGASPEFFLARLAPASDFAGKRVRITLWDPGEGMNKLELLDPNGSIVNFQYDTIGPGLGECNTDSGVPFGTAASFLPVSGTYAALSGYCFSASARWSQSKFNGRKLEVYLDIPSTYTAPNGGWYKIRYTAGVSGVTQDRTTWSVSLLGDPVHLVRE